MRKGPVAANPDAWMAGFEGWAREPLSLWADKEIGVAPPGDSPSGASMTEVAILTPDPSDPSYAGQWPGVLERLGEALSLAGDPTRLPPKEGRP